MKRLIVIVALLLATNAVAQQNKFSYPLQIVAGSSTAPAIVFYGDANTGIYQITADSIGFICGGVTTLRIGAKGLYWIGTYPNDDLFNRNDYWNSLGVGINATFTNYKTDTVGYDLDGTDDYLTVTDHDSLDFATGEFTLIWYGTLDTADYAGTSEKTILRKTSGVTGYYFYLASSRLRWNWYSEEINQTFTTMGLDSGYYQLAFTRNATGGLSWYTNGVLKSTKSGSGVAGNFSSSGNLLIGYGNAAGRYIDSRFHSIRLFSKCLTADQIATFYNSGKPDFYEQSDATMVGMGCRAQYLGRNATAATWTESLNSLDATTSGSPALITGEIMPQNTILLGNEETDYVGSYGNFIGSAFLVEDSLQIGTMGKYIRKVFQSAGGDTLGFIYYNTVRSRSDTVYSYQGVVQRAMESWVTHDAATDTVTLGVLPANAIVTNVNLWTSEAFNSDGTDQVSVGVLGSSIEEYATNVDVSSDGVETWTAGTYAKKVDGSSRTVVAVYKTSDATNLTQGKCHILVEWYQGTAVP